MKKMFLVFALSALAITAQAEDRKAFTLAGTVTVSESHPPLTLEADYNENCMEGHLIESHETPIAGDGSYSLALPQVPDGFLGNPCILVSIFLRSSQKSVVNLTQVDLRDLKTLPVNYSAHYLPTSNLLSAHISWGNSTLGDYVQQIVTTHPVLANFVREKNAKWFLGSVIQTFSRWGSYEPRADISGERRFDLSDPAIVINNMPTDGQGTVATSDQKDIHELNVNIISKKESLLVSNEDFKFGYEYALWVMQPVWVAQPIPVFLRFSTLDGGIYDVIDVSVSDIKDQSLPADIKVLDLPLLSPEKVHLANLRFDGT